MSHQITLRDYANDRDGVMLFWVGVGCPGGDYAPLGYSDLDFADRNRLLDAIGAVDESGDWRWGGEGDYSADSSNTIYKMHAYADQQKLDAVVAEYEND